MKTVRISSIAALLVASLVACSSEPAAEPAPEAPSSSPTADAVNGEPTREEGAKKYKEIVASLNKELDRCLPVFNPLVESGESSSSDLSKLRTACAGVPKANRKFGDDLTKATWPAEAQEAIDQLVDEVRADQLGWQEVSEVRTHDDLFNPKYPLAEDDGSAADLVRARLGLPSVEE
ncbi:MULTISPECIES: hypothetical protein [unclassified Streptomyces]|uniref:hypothetical protein n=1 Tax=unclassified Streptomyces TaxID=2593676 RepID=UPI0012FEBB17|nr:MULTISPECIES: hypothetical protein [unclassified Streptomyces]